MDKDQRFTKEHIARIRNAVSQRVSEDRWVLDKFDSYIAALELVAYDYFEDELEKLADRKIEWKKREDAEGEVFEQLLGNCEHEGETHIFTYFHMVSSGTIFPMHNHKDPEDTSKKTKEWYIFFYEEGIEIELCKEGKEHALINRSDKPAYALSIKVTRVEE